MKRMFAMVLALCCLAALMGGCKDKEPAMDDGGRFQEILSGSQQDDRYDPDDPDPQPGQSVKYEAGVVAEPLNEAVMSAPPVNGLQDLRYWVDDIEDTELRSEPSENNGEQIYTYTSEMDIVRAYLRMLQKNGWTLVGEEEGYKGGYYSWGLTCDAVPDADKFGQMFTDTPCHLSIYWTDSERYKFTFAISEDILVCDLGLRMEDGRVSTGPAGRSAFAGLERLEDGSFRTTDGRLMVHPGSAMVIRDGKTYTVDASYENDGRYERVKTEYYYRNEGFALTFPESSLWEGDIFRLWDLDGYRTNREPDGAKAGHRNVDYLQVHIACDGDWITPGRDEDEYESLFVRLMYREEGGMMVFYISAEFDDEPEEIEALVAVDMSLGQGEVLDATYLQVGDKITLRYTPPVGSESYQVYTWQVLEGDENVWIDGTGTTCEVRAMDAGSAVIRVTYEYTEDGYNVLTGNPEHQHRSATQDYYFIIE